jgi:hypothetical protein
MMGELEGLCQSWTHAVTSVVQGQWLMLDSGLQATQTLLASAAPASKQIAVPVAEGTAPGKPDSLVAEALERVHKGFAPPREIYLAPRRDRIDWAELPDWARPCNPDLFEGCSHEG